MSETANSQPSQRWAILGGVRFGLAALVLIGHARFCTPTYRWTQIIAQFGSFSAVLGFFLISGYSIAHSYNRRPDGFFHRRIQRLAPAYLVAILISLVPIWLLTTHRHPYYETWYGTPSVLQFFANALCLQGTVTPAISANLPLWSLGAEVVYYALTPFFFRLRSRVLLGFVGISALLYVLHGVPSVGFGTALYPSESYGISAICLAWAWLAGFLLWRHSKQDWPRWLMLGLGAALIGFDDTQNYRFSVAVYVAAALIVVHAGSLRVPVRLALWLTYLGDLSFPLYLVHYPILMVLHPWFNVSRPAPLLLVPLVVAILLHHAVEIPFGRRASRLKPSRPVGDLPGVGADDPERVGKVVL